MKATPCKHGHYDAWVCQKCWDEGEFIVRAVRQGDPGPDVRWTGPGSRKVNAATRVKKP